MKKFVFYLSGVVIIYLIYILINIFEYHFDNLNNYGYGFLSGKLILLLIFSIIMIKTNPFKKKKDHK